MQVPLGKQCILQVFGIDMGHVPVIEKDAYRSGYFSGEIE